MAMQRDGATRLEEFAVDGAQDSDDIVAPRRAPHDARMLINRLEELADHERDRLNPLDLLLRADELPLEVLLLVLDVLFLQGEEVEVLFELLDRKSVV